MTRRLALFVPAAVLSGCGYHLAGTADTIPSTVKTVAVPPFHNPTTKYRLTDLMPNLIAREFISRTRYRVVQNLEEADAVLQGSVHRVDAFPVIYDPATGRAAGVEMYASFAVQLREQKSGKVLYNNPSLVFRQRYEISTDPAVYFDESSTAFQRLSRDVARAVVSAVLESF